MKPFERFTQDEQVMILSKTMIELFVLHSLPKYTIVLLRSVSLPRLIPANYSANWIIYKYGKTYFFVFWVLESTMDWKNK